MISGSQSEVAPIEQILLKHVRDAFISQAFINNQWRALNYPAAPDYQTAVREYEQFVTVLAEFDIEVTFLPRTDDVGLDSLYVRDASVVCSKGVILCNMGKVERRAEPAAQEAEFRRLGIPICGAISGNGRLEGGDVTWIDERTLAVGCGYRSNAEGIRQLRELLDGCIDQLILVPLPHWRGPGDVFHLMSILSPIDGDLMLAYSPLMPIPFREELLDRGIQLVEVPDDEFESMGCNVLTVAPRRCIMLAGNPTTRDRLVGAGAEVREFVGSEISRKGSGGPTCLTRPVRRK